MRLNLELCLLSLDGGGVRGLSTLYILKRVMEAIDPVNPPKPCDYFHMICGTSTGGLIALMLGRMRLSVDQCIEAYNEMAPAIFTKLHHRIDIKKGETRGRFDHNALKLGVQRVLQRYGFDPEEKLKESLKQGDCKT
jgi:patatin-like phospholipase/acyl hydrolase